MKYLLYCLLNIKLLFEWMPTITTFFVKICPSSFFFPLSSLHAIWLFPQEIQSLLTNWKGPDLIGYGELVLEGTFRLQRAKNERTLFLFDKLLLITKKREETYTYKAHILVSHATLEYHKEKWSLCLHGHREGNSISLCFVQCCNLMLVEVIPKEPLSFSVFHYKNPKLQHTVQVEQT